VELTLVRHGQSTANRDSILQGQMDTQLSELGVRQARQVGAWFRAGAMTWDAAYCSPLQRARDTARAITEELGWRESLEDPDLQEIHMGSLQGKSADLLRSEYAAFYLRGIEGVGDYSEFGGESYDDVQARVLRFIGMLGERHRAAEHRVLVVSHGGFLFQLVKALVCQPVPRAAMLRFGNCTVTHLKLRERRGTYIWEIEWHLPVELLGGEGGRGVSALLY
jgi:broad specificity phosphatase PhoE